MPELQQMNARHFKILEMYLEGQKPGEIAAALGVTRESVTWACASAPFQHELARRRQNRENVHEQTLASTVVETRARLAQATGVAADKLIEHLDSKDERVSMMAVKEILERGCGSVGPQPINVNILSAERVALVLQSITESGVDSRGEAPLSALIEQGQAA